MLRFALLASLLTLPALAQSPTSAEAVTSMRIVGMLIGGAQQCGIKPARANDVAASALMDMAQNWEPGAEDVLAAALATEWANTPRPKDCRAALGLFRDLEQRLK